MTKKQVAQLTAPVLHLQGGFEFYLRRIDPHAVAEISGGWLEAVVVPTAHGINHRVEEGEVLRALNCVGLTMPRLSIDQFDIGVAVAAVVPEGRESVEGITECDLRPGVGDRPKRFSIHRFPP